MLLNEEGLPRVQRTGRDDSITERRGVESDNEGMQYLLRVFSPL